MRRQLHVAELRFHIVRRSFVVHLIDEQLMFGVLERRSVRLQQSDICKTKWFLDPIFVLVGAAMLERESQMAKLELFNGQLDLETKGILICYKTQMSFKSITRNVSFHFGRPSW